MSDSKTCNGCATTLLLDDDAARIELDAWIALTVADGRYDACSVDCAHDVLTAQRDAYATFAAQTGEIAASMRLDPDADDEEPDADDD